jgi:hypothetical protein
VIAIAAGTVLCTLLFFYASSIEHRIVAAAVLITALWVAERAVRSSGLALVFGALLGVSVATSFETIVLVALLAFWWFRGVGERHSWAVLLGATIPGLLLMLYATICFGAPWATPYAYRLKFEIFQTQGWNSAFPLSVRESLSQAPRFAMIFLVGRDLGLFTYAPFLLLTFFLVVPRFRCGLRRDILVLATTGAVLILAFHLVTGYRLGPGDFGPRYLILAIPFLALLLPAVAVPSPIFWVFWSLGLVVVMRGVMYGLLHEPFWAGYVGLLHEYGLTSYTLLKWKAVGGGLSPLVSSLAVACVIAGGVWGLFAWSRRGSTRRARDRS